MKTAHYFHITNGEAAAGSLSRAGLDGEVLGWSDLLCKGPLAAADDTRFHELRARYLASAGYAPFAEARDQLAADGAKLATARLAGELVLSFRLIAFRESSPFTA
jgi:hypothetical protein